MNDSRQIPAFQGNLANLNSLTCEEFVRAVGPMFENSPWIAEATWERLPFTDLKQLHGALMDAVRSAGREMQVKLIRAHPDLAGRAALAGTLTPESNREQAAAGLGQLSAEEILQFQKYNEAYRDRFGFPFVICARLNKKDVMLQGFEARLKNSPAQEIETALGEIGKIAWLRLQDLAAA